MTNDTCVKSSMAPQAYKVVSTHAHEIPGWTIISRPIHSSAPHIGGGKGDAQSGLATLVFNNKEKLNIFKAEFSDFDRKSPYLEKLYLLQDFYFSK